MTNILRCTIPKLSLTLLLIVCLISLAAPNAAAFELPTNDNKTAAAQPSEPADTKPAQTSNNTIPTVAVEPPTVAFIGYSDAMKQSLELPVSTPATLAVSFKTFNAPGSVANETIPLPIPPRSFPAVSTAPMTPGEKFKLFIKKSFLSPGAYVQSILSAAYGEWTDDDMHHHAKNGDFAADTMTRAARSFTFRMNANFFEKFAFASILRQDPRYHRSDKRGAGAKIMYAVSRVFVTQGDRCGCDQFNASFLFGGLAASGIANLYEREERRTVQKTFSRWTTHIGLTALTNILREFIGGQ